MNHLRSLLKYRFSFSRSGVELVVLHLSELQMVVLLAHGPHFENEPDHSVTTQAQLLHLLSKGLSLFLSWNSSLSELGKFLFEQSEMNEEQLGQGDSPGDSAFCWAWVSLQDATLVGCSLDFSFSPYSACPRVTTLWIIPLILLTIPHSEWPEVSSVCLPKQGNIQVLSLFQSCLTLCDPMGCSPPGSSVQGILQARIWEWVAISFSKYWCFITMVHTLPPPLLPSTHTNTHMYKAREWARMSITSSWRIIRGYTLHRTLRAFCKFRILPEKNRMLVLLFLLLWLTEAVTSSYWKSSLWAGMVT